MMKCEECGCEIEQGKEHKVWASKGVFRHAGSSCDHGDCIAALKARNTELERDGERLDWLEKHRDYSLSYNRGSWGIWYRDGGTVLGRGDTLRAAIDAAKESGHGSD